MIFQSTKSPSILQKLFVLGTLTVVVGWTGSRMLQGQPLGWLGGYDNPVNLQRTMLLILCAAFYLFRLVIMFLLFFRRQLFWLEALTVTGVTSSVLFLLIYIGGHQPRQLDMGDTAGLVLYGLGSVFSTYSELRRYLYKRNPDNKGQLYTGGPFKYVMHPNYFADLLLFTGFGLLAVDLRMLLIPVLMLLNFLLFLIPAQHLYMEKKYGGQFVAYVRRTRRLIPGIF